MSVVYVLDRDLNTVGIIDSFKSLIWANRYSDLGDCEVYVRATTENLVVLQENYYLFKPGSEMVCQIKKIELDTDAENGNYLIVTGYDVKRFLNQRVVWEMMVADGNAEAFIGDMINKSLGAAAGANRVMKTPGGNLLVGVDAPQGFTEAVTEQISYKNVGEKVRECCKTYGWGYRFTFERSLKRFIFSLYKGTDRSRSVVFSEKYQNLATSKFIYDNSKSGNVALVAGSGESSERTKEVTGAAQGVDRYEVYVDARDIAQVISYGQLQELFPDVQFGYNNLPVFWVTEVKIPIINAQHLARLQEIDGRGTVIQENGHDYYYINVPSSRILLGWLADLTQELTDSSKVELDELVYCGYLIARGEEKLAPYGAKTTFTGVIVPQITFFYGKDYFLGDIVTVENNYGISQAARIVEIIEVEDDNGYSVQPKFEYISKGD